MFFCVLFFVVYQLCDRFFLERVFLTSVVLFCFSLEAGHAALCELGTCRKYFFGVFEFANLFAFDLKICNFFS